MDTFKKKDFVNDIDYHLNEIEKDLNRAKFDNNRNLFLIRFFQQIVVRIQLLKELIVREPRAYFNMIFSEMKRLFKESFGELDGFYVEISFKKNPKPERMGLIKISVNQKLIEDEK